MNPMSELIKCTKLLLLQLITDTKLTVITYFDWSLIVAYRLFVCNMRYMRLII